MALTELQLPEKTNFYNTVRHAATEMDNLMHRWSNLVEMINKMETADFNAMSIATGQVRTDLIDFKVVLNEVVAFYEGIATTQTNIPSNIIDKIRAIK